MVAVTKLLVLALLVAVATAATEFGGRSGIFGSFATGSSFGENQLKPASEKIIAFNFYLSGGSIKALQVIWNSGDSQLYGTYDGTTVTTFVVPPAYDIVGMQAYVGSKVNGIQFTLSSGVSGYWYGSLSGQFYTVRAPTGSIINAFYGTSGTHLDSIGAFLIRAVTPVPLSITNGLSGAFGDSGGTAGSPNPGETRPVTRFGVYWDSSNVNGIETFYTTGTSVMFGSRTGTLTYVDLPTNWWCYGVAIWSGVRVDAVQIWITDGITQTSTKLGGTGGSGRWVNAPTGYMVNAFWGRSDSFELYALGAVYARNPYI